MNVPTIDIQKTGANIKTLRKAAGIKVKDVADTLGVSTQAVAKWQAGTALPTIDNLSHKACRLFDGWPVYGTSHTRLKVR